MCIYICTDSSEWQEVKTPFWNSAIFQGGEHHHLCLSAQFVTAGGNVTNPPPVKCHFAYMGRQREEGHADADVLLVISSCYGEGKSSCSLCVAL